MQARQSDRATRGSLAKHVQDRRPQALAPETPVQTRGFLTLLNILNIM